jgi:anaerobic selenocysteine-containing dehydrogenase
VSGKRPELKSVVRRPLSRRDLLKAAPLGAVAAGAAGLAIVNRHEAALTSTPGTCRFCLMHCGVVAKTRGKHLVKVEGDLTSRTRGFVCEHGFALREVVHSHERLSLPLVRKGHDFHEVSWAEALGVVAERLTQVKLKYGAQAFAIQTGWPLVRHPLVNFLHRFARAYGSPNVASVASLCEASLRMGQALTVGTKYAADVRRAKTLLVWGANPWVTAPPFAHVISAKALKGKLVVIDPVKTTLAKEATLHLPIRPGTDGALALGLIREVLAKGKLDEDFVRTHLHGFEELKGLAQTWPLERVEAVTGLPAAQVAQVAGWLIDEGPMGIWQGLGVEHHENGVQTVRALSALEVLCGRFDGTQDARSQISHPGEHFHDEMLPALYRMTTPSPVPPVVTVPPVGREGYPLFEMYNREAQGQSYLSAILEDRPYPVRAMMFVASNGLVTSSGTQQWERAAERLDLLVTLDPFFTFTARKADVVLPTTTFAESPDVSDDDAVAKGSLVPPQGEAWPDFKVITELARALGLGSYFPWADFHEAMRSPHVPFMEEPAMQPRPLPEAAEHPRFGTPTGKAELKSTLLEAHGHEGLPVWTPPSEALTEAFPLRLVTGPRPRAFINSQFHGVPSIEARLREPEALLHPDAAAKAKVTHGSRVRVESPHGAAEFRAVVTTDVEPSSLVVPAGWAEANVNRLIDASKRDPISGFPAFRSGVCRVTPVAGG